DETVNAIKNAIEQAEHMVDMHIDNVVVAVNGNHVQLHPCHGVVAVQSEDREIGDAEVDRVIDGAQVMQIPPERVYIDVIPKQYIVDVLAEITEPRGLNVVREVNDRLFIPISQTLFHILLQTCA